MRRWPDDIETLLEYRSAVRDAGGSRTHSNAALQAAAVPSGSSVTSVLARNRTWTSTFAGLHANPAHPEDVNLLAARRGVEPRLAVSRTAVQSGTLAGCVNQYPDLNLNQGLDVRRVQCSSLHHRDMDSRRLDLHQHLPLLGQKALCPFLGNYSELTLPISARKFLKSANNCLAKDFFGPFAH